MERQQEIDSGILPVKSSGRKRKYHNITSDEIKKCLSEYIIKEATSRSQNPKRLDNFRVGLIRFILKIPLELLKMVGTKNKFRHNKALDFAFGYCEAFTAFASSLRVTCEPNTVLQSFLEFVIMWFPNQTKVPELLDILDREAVDPTMIQKYKYYFETRKTKTLKHVQQWITDSPVLKTLFDFTIDVLNENGHQDLIATKMISEIIDPCE